MSAGGPPYPKHVRRRVVAAGVLALFAVATIAWFVTRPEEGFVVGILPLSDQEALLLVRANYESGPSRGWALRIRADGEHLWMTELPDTPDSSAVAQGSATDGEVVVIRVGEPYGAGQVVALDAASGSIRWAREASGRLVAPPVLRGDEVVLAFELQAGQDPSVSALALQDGELRWTHEPERDLAAPITDDGATRLAYRDIIWRVVALDAGGAERGASRVDLFGDACLVDQSLYLLHEGALVRADLATDPPQIERWPLTPAEPSLGLAVTCGGHGDDFVFFAAETSSEVIPPAVVVVVGRGGEVRQRIPLGTITLSVIGGEPDRHQPAYHPLRGVVSDFAPILVSRGEGAFELVVLDLQRGRVAWTSAVQRELLHYQVVRGQGDVYYLSSFGHITAIDGSNGHVLGAMRSSLHGIRGSFATAHRLWGYSSDWAAHPDLPWVVLDARTLERVDPARETLVAHEVDLERTLEWLGVPEDFRR